MTGVDTNIIVRLLTGDDPAQSAKAKAVFKQESLYVPDTVMLETEWGPAPCLQIHPDGDS